MHDLHLYESVCFLYESMKTHKIRNIFCCTPTYFAIKDAMFGIIRKSRLSKGIVLYPIVIIKSIFKR